MTFPAAPWRLRGDMWLSLFRVGGGTSERPPGWYAAGFADYTGDVLTYRELVVGRLVRDGVVPRVTVTDIWVDSVVSRDGGRTLWAIPKDLAELRHDTSASRHVWQATTAGSPIATVTFRDVPPGPRLPFALTTLQHRADGTPVVARARGSARPAPCAGRWDVGAAGPLAWLRGRRPVCSVALSGLRLTFGR